MRGVVCILAVQMVCTLREKLLHQAFLVGLEGFELLGFGGDQGVETAQA